MPPAPSLNYCSAVLIVVIIRLVNYLPSLDTQTIQFHQSISIHLHWESRRVQSSINWLRSPKCVFSKIDFHQQIQFSLRCHPNSGSYVSHFPNPEVKCTMYNTIPQILLSTVLRRLKKINLVKILLRLWPWLLSYITTASRL